MTDYNPPCAELLSSNPREYDLTFFTEGSDKRVAKAKSLCATCAIVDECLQLGAGMEFGIFGGYTATERQALPVRERVSTTTYIASEGTTYNA